MALNAKLLGFIAVLGGGGIGISLYLNSQSKGQVLAQQKAPKSAQEAAPQVVNKVIEKADCESSSPSGDLVTFLGRKHKESASYIYVSCKNTVVAGDASEILDKNWTGLFLKNAFDEVFPYTLGEKFEMTLEANQEGGPLGDIYVISFKNPKTGASIETKLESADDNAGKREIKVSIMKGTNKSKEIYLFIASRATAEDLSQQ